MRLGVFGGTFDPIHIGHLILAESCREACALDRVLFVVAGAPPHKPGDRTPVSDRLDMVRLAIAGHEVFKVSEIETKRPGPHYSYETLEALSKDHPNDDLFFLIGADSLVDLPQWRNPKRIAEIATLVVANRPGVAIPETPAFVSASRPVQNVIMPDIGISSKDLRRRLAEGRSIRYQVPRGVESYIREQELYRAEPAKA
jgi:nicotinate-nucleotide adenylyltransferase